ncbi:MAG: hypothetical protein H6Q08_2309, partial [Acidobacteria bacterium]|nr:hypothetical protein [Acidobacteriota bacterium]
MSAEAPPCTTSINELDVDRCRDEPQVGGLAEEAAHG